MISLTFCGQGRPYILTSMRTQLMFPCNHVKTSTDYVKVFGLWSVILINLAEDFNHYARYTQKQCAYLQQQLLTSLQMLLDASWYWGIFILSDHFVPTIFRANHNHYQSDYMKILGLILSLTTMTSFASQLLKCLPLLFIQPSKNPMKQRGDLINQIHVLTATVCLSFISFRLTEKGVSACVSNDQRLGRFRVGVN